jgi:hypothetical protein
MSDWGCIISCIIAWLRWAGYTPGGYRCLIVIPPPGRIMLLPLLTINDRLDV